jgi:hypothetical protein
MPEELLLPLKSERRLLILVSISEEEVEEEELEPELLEAGEPAVSAGEVDEPAAETVLEAELPRMVFTMLGTVSVEAEFWLLFSATRLLAAWVVAAGVVAAGSLAA